MADAIRNLTLVEVTIIIAFVLGLVEGVKRLKKTIREFFKDLLEGEFKSVNSKLDDMQNTITKLDTQTCKNFLVRYLADVERGEFIYESEQQRFWEEYDHYIDDLHENSYIKEWVAKLRNEGKLIRKQPGGDR